MLKVALHVETWSGPAAVHREWPELALICGGGRAVEVGVESFKWTVSSENGLAD